MRKTVHHRRPASNRNRHPARRWRSLLFRIVSDQDSRARSGSCRRDICSPAHWTLRSDCGRRATADACTHTLGISKACGPLQQTGSASSAAPRTGWSKCGIPRKGTKGRSRAMQGPSPALGSATTRFARAAKTARSECIAFEAGVSLFVM